MEIRDPIHGSIGISPVEVSICDSLEYQRLRAIKQLGFAEFSFPGATHNRFLHSIGVSHLAGSAFDTIFKNYPFKDFKTKNSLRQCVKLAALLHDIGHGPLSHTTEEVMPILSELDIKIYKSQSIPRDTKRRANHEDYTIAFITESEITNIINAHGEFEPHHVAALVDSHIEIKDDFFVIDGVDFRPILSQLVSSELDVDRMDYLLRDAYFCGTNYGNIELSWLIANLTYNQVGDKLFLALNRRALYTFDDFLLSRHHMHLMVYFHHKAIIYEEILNKYLTSDNCTFNLPANLKSYIKCTDYSLYEHLNEAQYTNPWAKRIATRTPYKVLFETHSNEGSEKIAQMQMKLEKEGIDFIPVNSSARLSKYHGSTTQDQAYSIYVVEHYDRSANPTKIEDTTEIFSRYEKMRMIERIYVAPEQKTIASNIIK
jgi:uncharacterized protein